LIYASLSLALGGLLWILYIAIEPFVRRRWPQILVSWTRVLTGDWRDPCVARDLLIGCASGVLIVCIFRIGVYLIPPLLGYAELDWPAGITSMTLMGARFVIARLLQGLVDGVFFGLFQISILFFLRILLRSQKAAITVFVVLMALSANPGVFAVGLVLNVFIVFILIRFGLVALAFAFFAVDILLNFPATLDVTAWYSGYGYAALAVLAAIVLYAFRTSISGRLFLASSHLDD
jgi:hypothetical protein